MSRRLSNIIMRIAFEPPFRRLAKEVLKVLRVRLTLRALWDISERPQYLLGLMKAADQAKTQGITSLSAIEFGVAAGYGLLILQREARAVTLETGIDIKVFGFDTGSGLPSLIGDYRDHPDVWRSGDYPMNVKELRAKLDERSVLVLGDIKETVPRFFSKYAPPPVGFIAVDLDLYSSTIEALNIFVAQGKNMLWHVPMYFDDVDMFYTHRRGGELLAIREFNESSKGIFIDPWRGIKNIRPFPEAPYLERFFVAHDLNAISRLKLDRGENELPMA